MFLISKNDINMSMDFVYKFNKFFRPFAKKNTIFDNQLLEFIYSNSEKEIKCMFFV